MSSTNSTAPEFQIIGLPGIGMIEHGDDLVAVIASALEQNATTLQHGDVVCVAQKIISKAEGCLVALNSVEPGESALELAAATQKDPRMVQLILDESSEVMRHKPHVLVVRHKLGFVGAHAGIDQSNVDHSEGEMALLLHQPLPCATVCKSATTPALASWLLTRITVLGVWAPLAALSAARVYRCSMTRVAARTFTGAPSRRL
jgi:F420-0:gamma-glutamyl ligase